MIASKIASRTGLMVLGLLAAAAYFAVTHTAHFLGVLPFLVFLVCPLMHFLMPGMHGGHGGHGSHDQAAEPQAQQYLPTHEGHAHHVQPNAQREASSLQNGGGQ